MIVWITSFASSFAMIFLKGFQYQNVIGGHYRAAFLISFAISVAEVCLIAVIATNLFVTLIPVSLGGAFGIVLSMYVHRKFMRRGKKQYQ